jgi:hypothetical protein
MASADRLQTGDDATTAAGGWSVEFRGVGPPAGASGTGALRSGQPELPKVVPELMVGQPKAPGGLGLIPACGVERLLEHPALERLDPFLEPSFEDACGR